MRPQQQNRRMRGRNNNNNNNNNNNRKGGQSADPQLREQRAGCEDPRLAQQIAEKYTTLARDATEFRRSRHGGKLSAARRALQPHHRGGPGADADPARQPHRATISTTRRRGSRRFRVPQSGPGRERRHDMNLEKYSERVRGFIQSAQQYALNRNNQQFTPEHILKALIDDEEGFAASLIERAGGDAEGGRTRRRRGS
jgi:hypothetical protein